MSSEEHHSKSSSSSSEEHHSSHSNPGVGGVGGVGSGVGTGSGVNTGGVGGTGNPQNPTQGFSAGQKVAAQVPGTNANQAKHVNQGQGNVGGGSSY